MNEGEFGRFAASIKCLFPNDKVMPNKEAMELWFSLLQDIDYKTAMDGLGEWAKENKWSPTIADIRKFGMPTFLPWQEAYKKANAMASLYGRSRPSEAWKALGDTIWNAIPSWEQFCMTEMSSYKEQLFKSAYEESVRQTEQKYVRRELIDGVSMPTLPG